MMPMNTVMHFLECKQSEQVANLSEDESEQEARNYECLKAYLVHSPNASVRDIAEALAIIPSTAHKWRNRVKESLLMRL